MLISPYYQAGYQDGFNYRVPAVKQYEVGLIAKQYWRGFAQGTMAANATINKAQHKSARQRSVDAIARSAQD